LALAGSVVLLGACAPPEPGPDQSAAVEPAAQSPLQFGPVSWSAPSCNNGVFFGCGLSNRSRCSDAGGPYYAGWDPSLWSVCQTACGLANPNSYCTWTPAQCTGTTFTGCSLVGQPTCSDWGNSGHPNWNDAAWFACRDACSSGNPNAYCTWKPPKTVAGTFSGCAQTGQPVCSDYGNSSYPNWTSDLWSVCFNSCTSNCPINPSCTSNCVANPNDNLPDDDALNFCLAQGGTVVLRPGSPGYIVANGLNVPQSNTTITSAAAPGRARILAAPTLTHQIINAVGVSNLNISYLEIDGNRPARASSTQHLNDQCFNSVSPEHDRVPLSNVILSGITGGSFHYNRSTRALCGTAFLLHGSGFDVGFNLIDDNGHGWEAPDASDPWSDGITLELCANSAVHDNWLTDDSDVGIVDGGGEGCVIQNNTVLQLNRHAFAGIQLGNFSGAGQGNGDHVGSSVTGNLITGGGRMSFGLGLGHHPWDPMLDTTGGTVSNNTVSGAIVNLMLDGAKNATVGTNTLGAFGGSPRCPGNPPAAPAAYTVNQNHAAGSSFPGGFTPRAYDGCIP
jgi:hypothetical protein